MMRRIIFGIVTLLLLGVSLDVAHAQAEAKVAAARAEYLRLRNNDPQGDAAQYSREWMSLASRMQALLAVSKHSEGSERLRLYAADTDLRVYRASRQSRYLQAAEDALRPVVDGSGPVDERGEALILLGDIVVARHGSLSQAAVWYERAVAHGGRIQGKAEQRLQGLRNGTFDGYVTSPDVGTPRLVQTTPSANRRPHKLVVLDPGHGGYDAGAVGRNGLAEKDVTLDVARRVRQILSKKHSISVLLTREDDEFVPLGRRTAYANSKDAAAFVSLHVNASPSHDGSGLEAYYLDNTNDAASRRLAERENGEWGSGGPDDLSFMLSDLIQSGKLEDSVALTRFLDMGVRSSVGPSYRKARFLGVKKAPFFVLVGAHMPCSLVEMFFVDHEGVGERLEQPQFRALLAEGIADGISRFMVNESPEHLPDRPRGRNQAALSSVSARVKR